MTRNGTLAAGVLALGLSYACLWFVPLGGYPFKIGALALMVAGLVLAVVELLAPHRCPCEDEPQLADDDIAVGPLTAGTIDAVLTVGPLVVDDEPELHAARVRGYIDPDTTGPIPLVRSFVDPADDDVDIAPAYEPAARHRADRG